MSAIKKSWLEELDTPVVLIAPPKRRKLSATKHSTQRAFAFDLIVAAGHVSRKSAADALRIARGLR